MSNCLSKMKFNKTKFNKTKFNKTKFNNTSYKTLNKTLNILNRYNTKHKSQNYKVYPQKLCDKLYKIELSKKGKLLFGLM
jgi:hypothetical protein